MQPLTVGLEAVRRLWYPLWEPRRHYEGYKRYDGNYPHGWLQAEYQLPAELARVEHPETIHGTEIPVPELQILVGEKCYVLGMRWKSRCWLTGPAV